MKELLQRVEHLETRVDGHEVESAHVHAPHGDVWNGDDFII
jgi:hypothetical protein